MLLKILHDSWNLICIVLFCFFFVLNEECHSYQAKCYQMTQRSLEKIVELWNAAHNLEGLTFVYVTLLNTMLHLQNSPEYLQTFTFQYLQYSPDCLQISPFQYLLYSSPYLQISRLEYLQNFVECLDTSPLQYLDNTPDCSNPMYLTFFRIFPIQYLLFSVVGEL